MADKANKAKVRFINNQIKDWQETLDSGKFRGSTTKRGLITKIKRANERLVKLNEEITGISYKGANFNLTKAQMGKLRWIKGFTGRTPTTVLSRVKPIDEAITEGNKEKVEKLVRSFKKDYPEFASMNFGKTKPTNKTSQDIDTVSTDTTGVNRAYKVVGSKKKESSKIKPKVKKKTSQTKVTEVDYPGKKAKPLSGTIVSQLTDYDEGKDKKSSGEMNFDERELAKVMRDNSGTGKGDPSSSPDTSSFRKVSGPDGWEQGKRVYKTPFGNITVDSTDEGMWGKGKTSEDAADLKKGGTAKKKKAVSKYGAKAMKFTNRGGMYKVKR
tara:strand:- start:4306 stop:5286 length:981 start_codon:yes stop_codon:yes gene_type:complete